MMNNLSGCHLHFNITVRTYIECASTVYSFKLKFINIFCAPTFIYFSQDLLNLKMSINYGYSYNLMSF